MEASDATVSSARTKMDTSVSDYDVNTHFTLPFGSLVPMNEGTSSMYDTMQIFSSMRDISMTRRYGQSPSLADTDGAQRALNTLEHARSDTGESSDVSDVVSDRTNGPPDDDVNEDFQPLRYARQYGLTTDYLAQNPLHNAYIPTPPASVLADFSPEIDSRDVNEAKALMEQPGNERWDIDKDTAAVLTSVMAIGNADGVHYEANRRSLRDLKVDEPVLSSDPDMDLSKLKARNQVHLSTHGMLPYELKREKDEGLAWSAEQLKLPSLVSDSIAGEKLDIDRDTMEFLRRVTEPSTPEHWDLMELTVKADQAGSMPSVLQRETTPLLPLSPSLSPCIVPDQVYDMKLTSSPENLFSREAAEIEAVLLDDDQIPQQSNTSSTTVGDNNIIDDIRRFTETPTTSSSSPSRQKRVCDLKADTPVLPQQYSSSATKKAKTVSFTEELHTLIPSTDTHDTIMDAEFARGDVAEFVAEVAAPEAKSVIDEIENEALDELDTTLRVSVTEVEAAEVVMPWERKGAGIGAQSLDNMEKQLLSRLAEEVSKDRRKWRGVSKLEQVLSWTPFPRYLGNVGLDEQFDDGSCERFLAELALDNDRPDIELLLWKPDGLRLLDTDDSEHGQLETVEIANMLEKDFIKSNEFKTPTRVAEGPPTNIAPVPAVQSATEPAFAQDRGQIAKRPAEQVRRGLTGMEALLKRRKLELEAASKPEEGGSSTVAGQKHTTLAHAIGGSHGGSTGFSFANGGLTSFLGLQGAEMLDTEMSRMQVPQNPPHVAPPVRLERTHPEPCDLGRPRTLPAPKLTGLDRAISVVVSSNMLANRQLVRELQATLPSLELIERDPASVASEKHQSSSAREADLTLSPSTGLICTTLQKLRQRPLPGQHSFFGIRDRIAAVSPQYECCVVMVSEGAQDAVSPITSLDERDAAAIGELIGFVNCLESNVEVCYVPGGDADSAKWIAASIGRRSSVDEDAKLLHDETIWERLLRTAGAGPAAAQSILARLKRPEIAESSDNSSGGFSSNDSSSYGLHAFVQMSIEEKVQQFGPGMGGDRVLRRISEAIDSRLVPKKGQ